MLQILDIKKSFGELHVLRGVDLDVEQGDVVAIIGPSGSGKTTLLRCINFLEKADSGTLIFDNEKFEFDKITKKEIARLRRKTAFVFQNYNLFLNKTALQNVTEGLIVARKMHKAEAIEIGKKRSTRSVFPTVTIITPRSFPAASSSALPLPAPLRQTRRLSSSTSRRARLTRSSPAKCFPSCATSQMRA